MKVINGGDTWFDEWGSRMSEPQPATTEPLFIEATSFKGKDVRDREWLIGQLIPSNTVTLLSGDGGTGKSLLALQLAIAVATGGKLDWLGMKPKQGTALYVGAEDDLDEMHRRINDIIFYTHDVNWDDLGGLKLASLANREALLSVVDPKTQVLRPSALFNEIVAKIQAERPSVVILDTLADLYPGNENDRAQARQFIGQLRSVCVNEGTTIVLLSHPSLSGMASGTGTSGNTAWNNSVRSRLYMTRIKEDGMEPDKSARKLTVMKSNYGETGMEILMKYDDGHFKAEKTQDALDRHAMDSKAERVFLQLLVQYAKSGIKVSPNFSANNSAATTFARSSDSQNISKKQFMKAQERLQLNNEIRVVEDGPPSRRVKWLVKGGFGG